MSSRAKFQLKAAQLFASHFSRRLNGNIRAKRLKTVDDLKGLKMRFFGPGANVMQKNGRRHSEPAAGEYKARRDYGYLK
jgi:TRAP-type mannitol/chloroaromatic compound transport system substrate-binding protein